MLLRWTTSALWKAKVWGKPSIRCSGATRAIRAKSLHLLRDTKMPLIHGHRPRGACSPTYNSWRAMIERSKGRGRYYKQTPMVCDRWLVFGNFLADMGERPYGCTVERVDNSGDYEPANCIWATHAQQSRNRSSTKMTEEMVQQLRTLREAGAGHKELATRFGISQQHVSRLCLGQRWQTSGH